MTSLTKKMAPNEFKWTDEAEEAMETLKRLASVAVPVKSFAAKTFQPEESHSLWNCINKAGLCI